MYMSVFYKVTYSKKYVSGDKTTNEKPERFFVFVIRSKNTKIAQLQEVQRDYCNEGDAKN